MVILVSEVHPLKTELPSSVTPVKSIDVIFEHFSKA